MQPATQAWWFAAGRLLGTVLIGFSAGWLLGSPWGGLACALGLHLGWQLANLFRLEWWLRHRSYAEPPDVGGVWGEIMWFNLMAARLLDLRRSADLGLRIENLLR